VNRYVRLLSFEAKNILSNKRLTDLFLESEMGPDQT